MTRRMSTPTMTAALFFLLHPAPGSGQYQIEFMNHSERTVHIELLDERGSGPTHDVNMRFRQAHVGVDGRVTLGAVLPSNQTYYLHVTPLDGMTPTKVITVRTGACCPSVTRTITFAVDSSDFPALAAETPQDQGEGGSEVANHPYLGVWGCQGSGTMTIDRSADGDGTLEGIEAQGWGPLVRKGGKIHDFRLGEDVGATMNVAYGDGTKGTFTFEKFPAGGRLQVSWTWDHDGDVDSDPKKGYFSCARMGD